MNNNDTDTLSFLNTSPSPISSNTRSASIKSSVNASIANEKMSAAGGPMSMSMMMMPPGPQPPRQQRNTGNNHKKKQTTAGQQKQTKPSLSNVKNDIVSTNVIGEKIEKSHVSGGSIGAAAGGDARSEWKCIKCNCPEHLTPVKRLGPDGKRNICNACYIRGRAMKERGMRGSARPVAGPFGYNAAMYTPAVYAKYANSMHPYYQQSPSSTSSISTGAAASAYHPYMMMPNSAGVGGVGPGGSSGSVSPTQIYGGGSGGNVSGIINGFGGPGLVIGTGGGTGGSIGSRSSHGSALPSPTSLATFGQFLYYDPVMQQTSAGSVNSRTSNNNSNDLQLPSPTALQHSPTSKPKPHNHYNNNNNNDNTRKPQAF